MLVKSLEIRYKYTKCKLHEQRKTSLIFRRLNILSRISDKSKCDSPGLFRQDVVSDDTGDQVGDKIVDTAMSRVLYLTDIFEHIIDRFDQGSLSQ